MILRNLLDGPRTKITQPLVVAVGLKSAFKVMLTFYDLYFLMLAGK